MTNSLQSDGITALEGYALGRMSERGQGEILALAENLSRKLRTGVQPAVDVKTLLAENAALRAQLAAQQGDIEELRGAYNRFKAWATEASEILHEHGLIEK